MIKLPENDPDFVTKELETYRSHVSELVESLRKDYFNCVKIIELDATQHPEVLFDQLEAKLESSSFSVCHPLSEAFKLPPSENSLKEASDADIFKYYSTAALRENEPDRDIGVFKLCCPVSFYGDKKLKLANPDIASTYKV